MTARFLWGVKLQKFKYMRLAVMQPYLFPYIGYFQVLNAAEKFVILDDVTFIKRGWINRNQILLNGKPHLFSVPLVKASQNRAIKQTKILYETNWQANLLKTLEQAYKKAPLFSPVMEMVSSVISRKYVYISDMALDSVKETCAYLDIRTAIVDSSEIYQNDTLKGEDRIIDICLRENASMYINTAGGRELYRAENFERHNIKLRFINFLPLTYKQFGDSFEPFLSVIDVLMFKEKLEVKELLERYTLEI